MKTRLLASALVVLSIAGTAHAGGSTALGGGLGGAAGAEIGDAVGVSPRRPFHTVVPGGVGAAVDSLIGRLRGAGARVRHVAQLAALERLPGGDTRLAFADGERVDARRPVLGVGAHELFAAAGGSYTPSRIRMAIAWVEVPDGRVRERPSVVHIPDAGIPAFRLSTGDGRPGHTVVTVELAHDVSETQMEVAALAAVTAAGIAPEGAGTVVHSVAAPAFVEPSPGAAAAFTEARAALDRLGLDAEVVGGAAYFGADSFNEQVVQGLRAEEATA